MAIADTAKLVVDLSLKGNFARQLSASGRALGKFDARLDQTESRAFRAGQQIGTGIKRAAAIGAVGVGILALNVERGLQSLIDLEKQTAQTNAAIKSTKGVAGITAGEIRKLAEEFESMNATIGDETIQETENLLLTFTNIRKKAFKPTLQAILDINERLGRGPDGLAGTARQVGKALNDPTKGLAALTRIGITFDAKTTARIKKLQKQGKLFEAQSLILKELNTRFGGSFLAGGQTTAGKVAKFHDAIEDLQRTLAAGMLPVVSNIADALSDLFRDPAIQQGVAAFGKDLAAFFTPARIKEGIGALRDLAGTIGPLFATAARSIGLVVSAFSKLPPDLRNLLVGAFAVNKLTGGLVGNIAGGLAGAIGGALKTIVAGNVTVIGKSVVGPGGIPDPRGGAPGKTGGSGVLGKALAVGLAGAIVAVAVPIGKAFANALPPSLKGPGGAGKTDSQRAFEAAAAAIAAQAAENRKLAAVALATQRHEEQTAGRSAAQLQRIADTMVSANALRADERGRGKAPGASTETANNIKELANKLTPLSDKIANGTVTLIPGAISRLQTNSINSINQMKTTLGANVTEGTSTTKSQGAMSRTTVRSSALTNAAIVASATRTSAGAIIAAIYAARPIVNVTQVTRTTTIQQRYGPSNGSAGTGHAIGTGPLP